MKCGSRHRSVRLGLLAIAIATSSVTIAQTGPLVEVTVVDGDTGQAIPHAKVILYDGPEPVSDTEVNAFAEREALGLSPGGRVIRAGSPRPSRSVETNDLGKSIFAELKAGSYRLDAEGDGYVPQRRQHVPGVIAGGTLVNVSGGDKTNVQVRLKRGDGIDQSATFDPNLLKQSSTLATLVRVSERSQTFTYVRMIRPR